jgi:hypothetical protein
MRPQTLVGAPMVGATLALVLSSCAPLATVGLAPDWVECAVQETGAETTATVDYTGARLQLPRGHTLDVPAEAVHPNNPVTISFRQMPTRRVEVRVEATPYVNLQVPATLTLSYEGRQCDVDDDDDPTIYRVRNDQSFDRLPVPPRVTPPEGRAVGLLDRFTLFAIAR